MYSNNLRKKATFEKKELITSFLDEHEGMRTKINNNKYEIDNEARQKKKKILKSYQYAILHYIRSKRQDLTVVSSVIIGVHSVC